MIYKRKTDLDGDFDSFDAEELRLALVEAGVVGFAVATNSAEVLVYPVHPISEFPEEQAALVEQVCHAHFETDWDARRSALSAISAKEGALSGVPRWGRELILMNTSHPLYAKAAEVEGEIAKLREAL